MANVNIQNAMIEESVLTEFGFDLEEYEHLVYSNVFVNMDTGEFLGSVHENDGEWRDEYFNPIFEGLGIKIKPVNILDLPKEQQEIWKKALEG